MTDILAVVAAHWRSQGLQPAGPATTFEITSFEQRHGVRLPPDVREYFKLLNGTLDEKMDRDHVAFWSLQRVRSVADELTLQEPVSPAARDFFCFADYSVWSNAYAVRLSQTGLEPTEVVAVYSGVHLVPVAGSFHDFLRAYVGPESSSVLHPTGRKDGKRHEAGS